MDKRQETPATSRNLLANFVSMLGGTVGSKILALLTVLMLTRHLGVEDFGQYSLVFSLWSLLNTLVDFGGTALLTREITKHQDNPRPSIESVIYLRLFACLLLMPVMFGLARFLHMDNQQLVLIFFGLLTGFEAFYESYFTGTARLDLTARTRLLASVWNLLLMGVAILLNASLNVILLIAFINPLIKLVLDLRTSHTFRWRLGAPDTQRIREFLRDGWPLWLSGLLYILLARVDIFMLEVLSPTGDFDLGIYSAAYRISEVLALLVSALAPALLPLLVNAMHEPARMMLLSRTGTRLIMAGVIALSLPVFWLAPWIIHLAYGQAFADASLCLRILIWSQALVAVNTIASVIMMVYNLQGRRPWILTGIGIVLLNIGLNFWLIPQYKAVGASAATLISECVGMLALMYFVQSLTPIRLMRDVLALSAFCLLALAAPLLLPGGDFLNNLLSVAVFVGLVLAARMLNLDEIRQLAAARLSAGPPPPR